MNITVELGGEEYTLTEQPIKPARAWRSAAGEYLGEIAAMLSAMPGIELSDMAEIGGLIQAVNDLVVGSVDTAIELVFAYSPELAADRERIEEVALSSEAVAVFLEVLKLAYPLAPLMAHVSGLLAQSSGSNSPSANGASGTKRRKVVQPKASKTS